MKLHSWDDTSLKFIGSRLILSCWKYNKCPFKCRCNLIHFSLPTLLLLQLVCSWKRFWLTCMVISHTHYTGDPDTLGWFQRYINIAASAVSLMLTEFWEQQSAAWFSQREAQLALCDITADDIMYYYVIALLSRLRAARVVSLLENPSAIDKSKTLKTHLLTAFGLTQCERAWELLSLPDLRDAKPLDLMDHTLTVLGT